jgi:DNA-binding winged helix-turn-helix (wHTH) protein
MDELKGTTLVFPPFRIDPDQRLLSREGQPVPLTPKEFDTLLALVVAGGKVLAKDALIARVWPDSYVGDGSLARNISVLRKALGEEVIETMPRRGYRLTIPVTSLQTPSGHVVPKVANPPELTEVQSSARRPSSLGRRLAPALAGLAGVVIASVLIGPRFSAIGRTSAHSPAAKIDAIRSVYIEKDGGLDPVDEGFKIFGPDGHYIHAMHDHENRGFDRWKLITSDQNYYYRSLSDTEKDFALRRDWKLTCVCAVGQGGVFSIIDFGKDKGSPRFDMEFLQEGDKYFVALTKQISPTLEFDEKIEFPGVADVSNPHTYQLRYDHLTRTASLWVDGNLMASGYHGHDQFRDNVGLDFGVASYLSNKTSVGVFRTVRFEAY